MRLETARDQFIAYKRTATRRRRPASPDTLRTYYGHLTGFIDWVHATTFRNSVIQMNSDLVRAYLDHRSSAGNLSMHSLNADSTALREFAAWGAKKRYWRTEDVDDIPYIAKPATLPRAYVATERDAIMALTLPIDEQVIRGLLYYAGMRASECLSLRLKDIIPPHALPTGETIQGSMLIWGKGSKERAVPIHDELWTLLASYLNTLDKKTPSDRTLLAKADGQPWGYEMLQRRVKRWGAAAKVSSTKSHRVRHTFATDVLDHGGDIREVRALLGHSSLSTTQVYLTLTEKRKAEAVARLPKFGASTRQTISQDSLSLEAIESQMRKKPAQTRTNG